MSLFNIIGNKNATVKVPLEREKCGGKSCDRSESENEAARESKTAEWCDQVATRRQRSISTSKRYTLKLLNLTKQTCCVFSIGYVQNKEQYHPCFNLNAKLALAAWTLIDCNFFQRKKRNLYRYHFVLKIPENPIPMLNTSNL